MSPNPLDAYNIAKICLFIDYFQRKSSFLKLEKLNSVFRIKLCFSELSLTNVMFYMSMLPSKGASYKLYGQNGQK